MCDRRLSCFRSLYNFKVLPWLIFLNLRLVVKYWLCGISVWPIYEQVCVAACDCGRTDIAGVRPCSYKFTCCLFWSPCMFVCFRQPLNTQLSSRLPYRDSLSLWKQKLYSGNSLKRPPIGLPYTARYRGLPAQGSSPHKQEIISDQLNHLMYLSAILLTYSDSMSNDVAFRKAPPQLAQCSFHLGMSVSTYRHLTYTVEMGALPKVGLQMLCSTRFVGVLLFTSQQSMCRLASKQQLSGVGSKGQPRSVGLLSLN